MTGKSRITIWFLSGLIIFVYGLAVTGMGIYNFSNPPQVACAELHLDFYWGLVLIVTGAIFLYAQRPGRPVQNED